MTGICFEESLFNAVVNGTKTQTRRIMNPQPIYDENSNPTADWDNLLCKPKYKVGEKVYLKEPYYRSNLMRAETEYKYGSDLPQEIIKNAKWQNKLFMPERYARYFIEITRVRCERLQDISDKDCLKEGIRINPAYDEDVKNEKIFLGNSYYIVKYADLIDEIYGKGTWESNQFVWVYDFKLLK